MSTASTRVRFAPSPTGMFHVGGARSALYNWAVARQSGGKFVLRIEDTDAARNKPEWIDGIISALASIGISKDDPAFEGPYFQSQNADRHTEAAQQLYAQGHAYYCDCTREQLQSGPDRSTSAMTASAGTGVWSTSRAGRCGSVRPPRARRSSWT